MSDTSARLDLPYILPSQAQKHVTHNEALQVLDLLVQPAAEQIGANTPPATPLEGQVWALGSSPTGDWAGHTDEVAAWTGTAWLYLAPQEGWQMLDKSTGQLMRRSGGTWEGVVPNAFDNLDGVGVNATHDATNRLAVSSPASLFSHEGAGHQLKVNKATATDTASLLLQTNWSGRAELGTAGSDDFSIKISPDGSVWTTALSFDTATAIASGEAITQSDSDNTAGRLLKVGDFGLGSTKLPFIADVDENVTASGTYFTGSSTLGTMPPGNSFGILFHTTLDAWTAVQHRQSVLSDDLYHRRYRSGVWSGWTKIHDSGNTTVDANGFIKEASPIVRLYSDRTEEPVVPVGAVFERIGCGQYLLSEVEPLAIAGWQIEVPQDANGNRLVFVETAYDADSRTLSVNTSEVIWNGRWVAGTPQDVPEGRWVDLRFHEPAQPEEA